MDNVQKNFCTKIQVEADKEGMGRKSKQGKKETK
jgi:hypothetical protein